MTFALAKCHWGGFGRIEHYRVKQSVASTGSFILVLLPGQFLKFLTRVHGARRVLEVGMLTGCSALCMAEALPRDGIVVTCEMEPYLVKVAQGFFERSPHGSKIHIRHGKQHLFSLKSSL